jgi:hypothetical protein
MGGEMKLCKNCKHFYNGIGGTEYYMGMRGYICKRGLQTYIDPIIGAEHVLGAKMCAEERTGSTFVDVEGRCGIEAKYWEAKEESQ